MLIVRSVFKPLFLLGLSMAWSLSAIIIGSIYESKSQFITAYLLLEGFFNIIKTSIMICWLCLPLESVPTNNNDLNVLPKVILMIYGLPSAGISILGLFSVFNSDGISSQQSSHISFVIFLWMYICTTLSQFVFFISIHIQKATSTITTSTTKASTTATSSSTTISNSKASSNSSIDNQYYFVNKDILKTFISSNAKTSDAINSLSDTLKIAIAMYRKKYKIKQQKQKLQPHPRPQQNNNNIYENELNIV